MKKPVADILEIDALRLSTDWRAFAIRAKMTTKADMKDKSNKTIEK